VTNMPAKAQTNVARRVTWGVQPKPARSAPGPRPLGQLLATQFASPHNPARNTRHTQTDHHADVHPGLPNEAPPGPRSENPKSMAPVRSPTHRTPH